MKHRTKHIRCSGFTVIEVMIATALSSLVIMGALASFITCKRLWFAADLELGRARNAAIAMQKMVSGAYAKPGLRMAEWNAMSPSVTISNVAGLPSRIDYTYGTTNCFILYDASGTVLNQDGDTLGENVSRLLFTFEASRPGTVKIDLTLNFSPNNETEGITRLVTWVAMRNR